MKKLIILVTLILGLSILLRISYNLGQTNQLRYQAKKSENLLHANYKLNGQIASLENVMLKHGISPQEYKGLTK